MPVTTSVSAYSPSSVFADKLRDELETEPRKETVRLFERLQQGAGA